MIEKIKKKRLAFAGKRLRGAFVVGIIFMLPLFLHLFRYNPFSFYSFSDVRDEMKGYCKFVVTDPVPFAVKPALGGQKLLISAEGYTPSSALSTPIILQVYSEDKAIFNLIYKSYQKGKKVTFYGIYDENDISEKLRAGTYGTGELPFSFYIYGHIPYFLILMALIGLAIISVGIYRIVQVKNESVFEKLISDVKAFGFSQEEIDEDFSEAEVLAPRKSILLGGKATYVNLLSDKPRAFLNEEISEIKHVKSGRSIESRRFNFFNFFSAVFAGIAFVPIRYSEGNPLKEYFGGSPTDFYFYVKGESKPVRVRTTASWGTIDYLYQVYKTTAPRIKTVYTE